MEHYIDERRSSSSISSQEEEEGINGYWKERKGSTLSETLRKVEMVMNSNSQAPQYSKEQFDSIHIQDMLGDIQHYYNILGECTWELQTPNPDLPTYTNRVRRIIKSVKQNIVSAVNILHIQNSEVIVLKESLDSTQLRKNKLTAELEDKSRKIKGNEIQIEELYEDNCELVRAIEQLEDKLLFYGNELESKNKVIDELKYELREYKLNNTRNYAQERGNSRDYRSKYLESEEDKQELKTQYEKLLKSVKIMEEEKIKRKICENKRRAGSMNSTPIRHIIEIDNYCTQLSSPIKSSVRQLPPKANGLRMSKRIESIIEGREKANIPKMENNSKMKIYTEKKSKYKKEQSSPSSNSPDRRSKLLQNYRNNSTKWENLNELEQNKEENNENNENKEEDLKRETGYKSSENNTNNTNNIRNENNKRNESTYDEEIDFLVELAKLKNTSNTKLMGGRYSSSGGALIELDFNSDEFKSIEDLRGIFEVENGGTLRSINGGGGMSSDASSNSTFRDTHHLIHNIPHNPNIYNLNPPNVIQREVDDLQDNYISFGDPYNNRISKPQHIPNYSINTPLMYSNRKKENKICNDKYAKHGHTRSEGLLLKNI